MEKITLTDLEQDQQQVIEKTDINTLAEYCIMLSNTDSNFCG